MMDGRDEDPLEEFFTTLIWEVRRRLHPRGVINIMRRLRSPSEKLVYLYLYFMQPQTFSGVRKGLNLGKATVARALKSLIKKGLIYVDGNLYWIKNIRDDGIA
ncbi:TPA: hypothetical protein EYP70_07820 [Candidatus Bathyarchaeota archaeon]|nr:hypothetical protein [Candidatus Bathyarchaeota archaeon]